MGIAISMSTRTILFGLALILTAAGQGQAGTLDIEEIIDGQARGIVIKGELSAVPEPHTAGWVLMLACWASTYRRKSPQPAKPR